MSFPILNKTFICDTGGCPAVASVVAMFDNGNFLVFCKHHTNKYFESLTEQKAWLDYQ
jgi:uncharacterized pyridoxamine 5'-phosphate oxidase family protein